MLVSFSENTAGGGEAVNDDATPPNQVVAMKTDGDRDEHIESTLPQEAAARQLVQTLIDEGVDTFFGICGGPAAPIFEAIRLNPKARFIQCRH